MRGKIGKGDNKEHGHRHGPGGETIDLVDGLCSMSSSILASLPLLLFSCIVFTYLDQEKEHFFKK